MINRSPVPGTVLWFGSVGLFAVSTLFPLAASVLATDRLPGWVGVADVLIAATLVAVGMIVVVRAPAPFTADVVASSFRAYRVLASGLLLLLLLFFVAGEHIRWGILLPGLAWRGWLLALVLPSWLSLKPSAVGATNRSRPMGG